MIKAMTIRDAYAQGFDWGYSLASWNLSEISFGMELRKDLDWIGIGAIETVEDWLNAVDCVISAAGENARQYSPFEFTAAAINARDESYGEGESEFGWDAFDRGMNKGVDAYRKKHYPVRELRKMQKEYEDD